MSIVVRSARADELEAHGKLREEGYGFAAGYGVGAMAPFHDPDMLDRLLGAHDGDTGELAGTLAVVPFGQCFGGRVIRMGGVGGVVVAPHRRGEGVASLLLARAVEDMRVRGETISALGPATMGVYRRAGWAIAGDQHWSTVPTAALAHLSGDSSELLVRRSTDADSADCQRVYDRAAVKSNGMVIRPAFAWESRLRAQAGRYRYVVCDRSSGEMVGYVIYREQRAARGGYQLFVDDLHATSWGAEAALWRLLGAQEAQAREVVVCGLSLAALQSRLPEQVCKTVHEHQWMLRLNDAPAAVAARGYAPAITASVLLRLTDPMVVTNNGRFTLIVQNGSGALVPTAESTSGEPVLTLDIGTLSALYSGHVSAYSLAAAGKLDGAHDADLANLDAIFRGAPSVMAIEEF